MLEKLKTYLGVSDDEPLSVMIENAKAFAVSYCNLSKYADDLDPIVFRMVVEDYNRYRSEGIASKSYGGISESYLSEYSPQTITALRKRRKIRLVKGAGTDV